MQSVTDRQTDGQQDDANSQLYCVAVRSAKNMILISLLETNIIKLLDCHITRRNGENVLIMLPICHMQYLYHLSEDNDRMASTFHSCQINL